MSIRAYRINKIELKEQNTFNLWHEKKLMDELESDGYLSEQSENGGRIVLPVEYIKELLEKVEIEDEHVKKEFLDDIEWAKKVGVDYVSYDCY